MLEEPANQDDGVIPHSPVTLDLAKRVGYLLDREPVELERSVEKRRTNAPFPQRVLDVRRLTLSRTSVDG